MSNDKWWEKPGRFVGNKFVCEYKERIIHQYGCCGRIAFFVGDKATRKILKLPLFSFEDAKKWIDQEEQKNLYFQKEVQDVV
jgi:hypothetical protein